MSKPKLEKCRRVLVVEGYDDLLFYAEVLEHLSANEGVFIQPMGGRANIQTKLDTFLTPARLQDKEAIGVIVDADSNGAAIAESLEKTLSKLTGQQVTVGNWTSGSPRIGLFVVPTSSGEGEIESLVWKAWANDPSNANARGCIDTFIHCMSQHGLTAHSRDKGRVGALLAIRNDEDPRLGPGARANLFDFERPEFQPLLRFLSGL